MENMNISALVIDTFNETAFPSLALDFAKKIPGVNEIITLSHREFFENSIFIRINKISSIRQYNDILINVVPNVVSNDFILVVQWDGMPTSPNNWKKKFLNFDYIGALWPHFEDEYRVGNGGFSLRSRKLLDTLQKLKLENTINIDYDVEDVTICRYLRPQLEGLGIRYADEMTANEFSFESGQRLESLGFHGIHNIPFYLAEEFLINNLAELINRLRNPIAIKTLYLNCIIRKYIDLASLIEKYL